MNTNELNSIDGEAVKPETQEETQEQPAVDEGNKKKNEWSLAVIVMFSLAGALQSILLTAQAGLTSLNS